ncbi:MAG: nucleotidyltransferase family protein [Sulfuricellaceae bacterium]|nr:nucleotidyltransferase family protein [Sulfuricellaceae bacterium]
MADSSPLLDFLSGKVSVDRLDAEDFSLLFAEARACGLMGRLAHTLQKSPLVDLLPSHLGDQLSATTIYSNGFRRDVWRELGHIEQALSGLNTPVILLKGASYVLLGLPSADGRIFSDIDILVTKTHIAVAEAALMLGGWSTGKLDAYDQRYYREWSHEIPPMTHLHRGTTIDLHHSLAMPTCRVHVDSARMISDAVPANEEGFWWRLKDEDMVLHAASHLLLNSEFDRGLRDIWDIDLLYRHFTSISADYPEHLLSRAREVGLESILTQALWLASAFFRTPLPDYLLPDKTSLFSRLLACAASTRHPETRPRGQKAADLALRLREMYLRLPGKLLAVHLLHKMSAPFSTPEKVSV